jgi:putative endonuclease
LVYAQPFEAAVEAIENEKRLKRWRWAWKVRLIAESNPEWRDLSDDLAG